MTPEQQAFEDRCWEHYLAERARRTMPGDVEGEPTREGLFWREADGRYGVLAFNTAWQAYQWGLEATKAQGVPDGLTLAAIGHKHFGNPIPQEWYAAAKELLASAPPAQQAIPPELDVRKIMLSIEPGEDGMGEEVYAKSVADVEAVLGKMGEELEDWQLGIRRLPAPQAKQPLSDESIQEGFAVCGLGGINAKLGFYAGVKFAESEHSVVKDDDGASRTAS